jgi:ligand-binding sensor domain-containing protein/serine phosphatase RsbU (regulator of sigma subunit)
MKRFFLFLIIIFSCQIANSQYNNLRFEHLSVSQGLSQSSVYSIAQDKHGFMWFATLDGLDKFDGYEIVKYYAGKNSGELPDNVINCLYTTSDPKKQLWIGTADHGICYYDAIFDKFINYSHQKDPQGLINDHVRCITGDSKTLWIGTEHGLSRFRQYSEQWKNFNSQNSHISNNYINALLIDNQHNLWIGTKSGLFVLDTVSLEIKRVNIKKIIGSSYVSSLSKDVYGNVWIATNNGICYYDYSKNKILQKKSLDYLPDKNITALKYDFQNILWIGTKNDGLVRYNPNNDQFKVYRHDATDPNSLSVNSILSIYEDKNHLLWVGTSLGGVDKWNRAAQELMVFRHNPYNPNSLSSSRVRNIYEDKKGNIWIGTVDGGLDKWNKNKHKFIWVVHNPKDKNSIPENHIRVIFEDSKNRYWIGTANSGAAIINPKTLRVIELFQHTDTDTNTIGGNSIWRIIEDKNDVLWFATYGGGLSYLDNDKFKFKTFKHSDKEAKSLSSNFCTTLFQDSKGRLWIGTIDGLNLYEPKTKSFKIFKNDVDDTNSLSNNRIYSILEDSDGQIWIGTKGGLNKYLENGKFQNFTVKNSQLPNNVIMGILEDKQKNLWLTTNQGLCKFNRITYRTRTYDVNDGLQSNEFLVGSYLKTSDGMFIVGGINGFNAFYPQKIKINPNKPSIVITEFMVSNKIYKTDTNISEKKYLLLNHNQRDLTFNYVAIDYILPQKNQYAYMLQGYDKNWIYTKYNRIAKYTNLSPGKYVFRVKGSNNDLIWNNIGTAINIYIKPAWWQRTIFKIIAVLFVILLVVFGMWLRMRILQRQKKILEQEVDRQTKEIREKKEEIEAQNSILQHQKEEIEAQREIAVRQRDLIARHQKEIEDSIIYAKNIQTAAMPENKFLQMLFEEFFVLFKPRDIVSGDFYWASQRKGKLIAVAADCTGHGVPGAFMSMLGISFLHKIVNEKNITEADQILERLRSNVIKALKQTIEGNRKDGMDLSMCVIDYKTMTLQYAGANNPLYLIRNNELIEYKPQKMPVAIYDYMKPFSKQIINFQKNDVIYMFSDGYADQFGGPKSKKFKYSNMKKIFLKIHNQSMKEQKKYLEDTLERWMNYPDKLAGTAKHSQIDDILIFAIRL